MDSYNDFTTMEYCSPASALILASEYDRARTILNWSIPVINLHRWKPDIVDLLDEIGFFDLLAIQRPMRGSKSTSVQTVKFLTGSVVARDEANQLTDALAKVLIDAVPNLLLSESDVITTRMQLFGALQEATENTCQHAYLVDGCGESAQRWWMTGAVDPKRRHINLVVYDQGRSIPATLPDWDKYSWVESRLARAKRFLRFGGGEEELDAVKMRLAMDAPRSSTGLSHRGKGFPAFKYVVERSERARLRIVSRRGEFVYEKGHRPQVRNLRTPLNGTLVEWDLWL